MLMISYDILCCITLYCMYATSVNYSNTRNCIELIVHIDLLIDLNCVDRCIDSCFKGGIGKKGSNRPSPPQTILAVSGKQS
jgi:hypothetical protein